MYSHARNTETIVLRYGGILHNLRYCIGTRFWIRNATRQDMSEKRICAVAVVAAMW